MVSRKSPTVPDQLFSDANASGSVVRKLKHHSHFDMELTTVLSANWGGTVRPFRTSRKRAPATGTSTVTSSVSYPAEAARSMRAIERSRSFHIYSWNQLRPFG